MRRVAVMGAGAVGCYYGGMLARAGADVVFITRGPHLEALIRDGLFFDALHSRERLRVRATGDPSAVRDADLVLLSVKTTATEQAARAIAPHVAPGALLVSQQNGVDNVARIRAATGIESFATVVYVAAQIPEPGHLLHQGRGDLVIGDPRAKETAAIAETFERAGVPCRITDNIEGELWIKFILNCAGNAVVALGRCPYGALTRNPLASATVLEALAESKAVALAAGVKLPTRDPKALDIIESLRKYGPATSSMAQDILHGRRTEIDSLNGYVARLGQTLGVAVPVNRTLHALVKLLEESL